MPNMKITDYDEKLTVVDDDLIEIVDSETTPATNKKVKASTLKAYILA